LLDLGDESIARWRPWRIKKERSGEAERWMANDDDEDWWGVWRIGDEEKEPNGRWQIGGELKSAGPGRGGGGSECWLRAFPSRPLLWPIEDEEWVTGVDFEDWMEEKGCWHSHWRPPCCGNWQCLSPSVDAAIVLTKRRDLRIRRRSGVSCKDGGS
jgi:hypothetical protein